MLKEAFDRSILISIYVYVISIILVCVSYVSYNLIKLASHDNYILRFILYEFLIWVVVVFLGTYLVLNILRTLLFGIKK